MPEHQERDDVGKQDEEHWHYVRRVSAPVWVIWSTCLFAALIGVVAHYHVNEHSVRIKFFIEALFSFAALAIVITQAVIYSQQRNLLKRQVENAQFSERAYIGIKAAKIIDLEVGKVPYVMVDFQNGGRTPAFDAHTVIELLIGKGPPKFFDKAAGFILAGLFCPMRYSFGEEADAKFVSDIESKTIWVRFRGEVKFRDCWGNDQSDPIDYIWLPQPGVFQAYKTFCQEQAETQKEKAS
jgi:hypothetical protein